MDCGASTLDGIEWLRDGQILKVNDFVFFSHSPFYSFWSCDMPAIFYSNNLLNSLRYWRQFGDHWFPLQNVESWVTGKLHWGKPHNRTSTASKLKNLHAQYGNHIENQTREKRLTREARKRTLHRKCMNDLQSFLGGAVGSLKFIDDSNHYRKNWPTLTYIWGRLH